MADLSPELGERCAQLVHHLYDLRKITGMQSPYAHGVYLAERLFHELPKPVDPDLIEARKLVADRYNPETCSEAIIATLKGEDDDTVAIKNCLIAIKRGRELERN